MPYPIVDPKLSTDALEKQLLATWKHERLFEKTREAMRYGPPFVFFEGPPTANGRPGIHHVFARTIKDLVCRYHTMLGQAVTRIAGWDTHGLPVEIEVERVTPARLVLRAAGALSAGQATAMPRAATRE